MGSKGSLIFRKISNYQAYRGKTEESDLKSSSGIWMCLIPKNPYV